jgi:hypothetical protein
VPCAPASPAFRKSRSASSSGGRTKSEQRKTPATFFASSSTSAGTSRVVFVLLSADDASTDRRSCRVRSSETWHSRALSREIPQKTLNAASMFMSSRLLPIFVTHAKSERLLTIGTHRIVCVRPVRLQFCPFALLVDQPRSERDVDRQVEATWKRMISSFRPASIRKREHRSVFRRPHARSVIVLIKRSISRTPLRTSAISKRA